MWELDCEESWVPKKWCFWTVVLEKTLESPLDCKEIQSVHSKGDQPWVFFRRNDAKAGNSSTLATSCKELTHWKRLWCWEGLGAGGEGDGRGWDGWMASPTQWTWVWVDFGSWWWTGRPGVLRFMGLQRVGHDWATELKLKLKGFYSVDFQFSSVNILSRLVITFLPRGKRLLISVDSKVIKREIILDGLDLISRALWKGLETERSKA